MEDTLVVILTFTGPANVLALLLFIAASTIVFRGKVSIHWGV